MILVLKKICVTMLWCLHGFNRLTMQGMELVVEVLIPDTSFWLKRSDIRCQWLLCISRLVSKHRQVMLDCMLGKTGNGEDHWCSSHKLINEVNTRACLLLYGRLGMLLPQRVFTWCIVMYCFWGGFTWRFSSFSLKEEHSSNAGATRAHWCSCS